MPGGSFAPIFPKLPLLLVLQPLQHPTAAKSIASAETGKAHLLMALPDVVEKRKLFAPINVPLRLDPEPYESIRTKPKLHDVCLPGTEHLTI